MNNNKKDDVEQSIEEDYEEITKRDAINAVVDIFNDYKKSYKQASRKDKTTILAIFLPLVATFVLGFVGILLANIGKYLVLHTTQIIGFVLMGVGLGGFFLIIVILMIWSKIKERR